MSLVAHRFGRVEFQKFAIVFFRQAQLKKSKQIFEIRHIQIDELPNFKRVVLRVDNQTYSRDRQ